MKLHTLQKPLFFGIALIGLAVLVLALIYSQARIPPQNSVQSDPLLQNRVVAELKPGSPAEVKITQSAVAGEQPGSFVLFFPENVVDDTYIVNLMFREPGILDASGESGWRRLHIVNVILMDADHNRLGTHEFTTPLAACFSLPDEMYALFTKDPGKLRVEHFNDQLDPARWEPLPLLTHAERRLVCGETHSLSLFALAQYDPNTVPVTGPQEPYSP